MDGTRSPVDKLSQAGLAGTARIPPSQGASLKPSNTMEGDRGDSVPFQDRTNISHNTTMQTISQTAVQRNKRSSQVLLLTTQVSSHLMEVIIILEVYHITKMSRKLMAAVL